MQGRKRKTRAGRRQDLEERAEIWMRRKLPALLMTALLLIPIRGALGQEYHAQAAVNWMEEFTRALAALSIVNDPAQTADPSRPGEYLMEYEFGTVLARSVPPSLAEDILEIDAVSYTHLRYPLLPSPAKLLLPHEPERTAAMGLTPFPAAYTRCSLTGERPSSSPRTIRIPNT